MSQSSGLNPNLELKLIVPTGDPDDRQRHRRKQLHSSLDGHVYHALRFQFREKNNFADLTGLARIKMVTKVSGYHKVMPIVKLADGTMRIGDRAEGSTVAWLESDIAVSELRWRKLDPARLVTVGDWVNNPNLTSVDEIGFADLMPGSGHGQGVWSDVARVEVYAKQVNGKDPRTNN